MIEHLVWSVVPKKLGPDYNQAKPLNYIIKTVKRMTIFVEHTDIISHIDPNTNPNNEKIMS